MSAQPGLIAAGRPGEVSGAPGRMLLRNPLVRVVVRRLFLAVPLLFVVSSLSFILVSLTPGNAASQILGTDAPPSAYPKLRHALGLDLPIYQQYWRWLDHALHGDLGASLYTSQSVTQAIDARVPVTLSLIFGALLLTVVVGVSFGLFSAVRGGVAGRLVDGLALVGFAFPSFWVGAILISIFAIKLPWFPAIGYVSFAHSPGQWLRSLALPVIALSLHGVAAVAKQTREATLDVLGSEYIRLARANGISERSIIFRHALKNSAVRVLTILGLQAVGLLGGTVLVESVFALPGMGGLAVTASIQHDLPVVEGIVVYFTVVVVLINLVIDLAYTWLNPRVRTG